MKTRKIRSFTNGNLLDSWREQQRKFGRWAFVEFTEIYGMEVEFKSKVEAQFNQMIESVAQPQTAQVAN